MIGPAAPAAARTVPIATTVSGLKADPGNPSGGRDAGSSKREVGAGGGEEGAPHPLMGKETLKSQ